MSTTLPAVLLLGPTATGKTDLALWLADRWPVDIISVDSAMVYRDMDIGTAKPEPEILARHPHGLVDVVTPEESYSAGRFAREAIALATESRNRGRLPLLVGGTMFYFHALLRGLDPLPEGDEALRRSIDARAEKEGWPALHAELAALDPDSAARIMPWDGQRIQRALEIYHLAGTAATQLMGAEKETLPLPWLGVFLEPMERSDLHRAIERRFHVMLEQGLIAEVECLQQKYSTLSGESPAMRAVGYRQVWQYLQGDVTKAEMVERGVAATRQLAKRQMAWKKKFPEMVCFDCRDGQLRSRVAELVAEHLVSARRA